DINPLDDKWDALSRYKYHISLESFVCPDYFTCKLTDAFLGGALPFYFGAPNIFEYFPPGSLIPININNVDGAYRQISQAIDNDTYGKSNMQLQLARNKVLDEYNIFPGMVKLMNTMSADGPKEEVTLIPARRFQSLSVRIEWKVWTEFFLWRTKGKAEKAIYELSKGKIKE